MATTARMMSIEDFLALPDDGCQYELVRGELIEMPGSGFEHSDIGLGLGAELRAFVRARGLGRVTGSDGAYVLNREQRTVLVPDAAFVRAERLPPPDERSGVLELAPDLVVEVASPHDSANMIADKVREYLDAGVRLVWVILPRRRMAHVYTQDQTGRLLYEDDILDGGDVLPGFEIRVGALFE